MKTPIATSLLVGPEYQKLLHDVQLDLDHILLSRCITQSEMARRTNVSRAYICQFFSRKRAKAGLINPTLLTLENMARHAGYSTRVVFEPLE